MVAALLRSALTVAALVASTSALQLQLQRSLAPSSSAVRLRRTLPRLDASGKSVEAETKQLAADKAALEAERATLQAEILSLKGEKIKLEASPRDESTAGSPPPAAATAAPTIGASEIGASVEALCQVLNGIEFPGVGVLQAASLGAWDVARRQQTDEIAALVARVQLAEQVQGAETPEAELDLGGRAARQTLFLEEMERSSKASLGLADLWQLSENRSFDSDTERRVRARALSRQVLGFLCERVEGEEKEEECVAVPGEGLVALGGAKARLRSLRRHEAAGLVEWRLFGEVLARDDRTHPRLSPSPSPSPSPRPSPRPSPSPSLILTLTLTLALIKVLARDDELGAALELDELLCEEDALRAVQALPSRHEPTGLH
jgi:hypothetical protein